MISVITISRSNTNLERLFKSFNSAFSDIKYEWLIGWNGDNECQLKPHKTIKVKVIRPYHFSRNNNELSRAAVHPYLLFLNDDMVLDEQSVVRALKCILTDPSVGIVGANLRYPSGNIQHAGIDFSDDVPRHPYKNAINYLDPLISGVREVPAVTGAFMLTRKSDFNLVGGFDELCEVAAQDVILCIDYKSLLGKKVIYNGRVRAVHYENETRKLLDQKTTPEGDLKRVSERIKDSRSSRFLNADRVKLRVVTERPGWILYRKAEEICRHIPSSVINKDFSDANIHYYINYGFFQKRPERGLVVANFTHYDPNHLAEKWNHVAKVADHCVAVSPEARDHLLRIGVPEEKISLIIVGADESFRPSMTLGVVGRVYPGGRKGEHLIASLLEDPILMSDLKIVSASPGWGLPVRRFDDLADFYSSIDYLLIPSLLEGGPVPFMEALAVGTLSIAPPIGVIPMFPHIPYKTGNLDSLKDAITNLKVQHLSRKRILSSSIEGYNWTGWAMQHIRLFNHLLGVQ